MAFKYRFTPRGMVLWVLGIYAEESHSVKDIQSKILHHFEYEIDRRTIVAAIDESDQVSGQIIEREERRGMLNLPVKVFSIQFNKE